MKAVMPDLLPDVAESRKRTGADQWGEMRKGVLHMPPMPIDDHQDLERGLETYLRILVGPAYTRARWASI